jgi:hypothetical protein
MAKFNLMATVAATCVAAMVSAQASAATLIFTTSGAFTAPVGADSPVIVNTPTSTALTIGTGVEKSTLTFTNTVTPQVYDGATAYGFQNAMFGTFSLSSTTVAPNLDVFDGVKFTLSINQSLPFPAASNTTVATFTGSVNQSQGNVLTFSFDPNGISGFGDPTPLAIGPISYQIQTPAGVNVGATATLDGGVFIPQNVTNVVPLPPAAYAGMLMLGSLGIRRWNRRQTAEV